MSETVVCRELDYKTVDVSHGTYVMNQITQMTGGTGVTITTAGGNESIFEINPKVINYRKSYLRFTSSCPALAGNVTTAFAEGVPHMRQIQFYTRGRVMPVDITDVNKYLAGISRYENKMDDVQTWDKPVVDVAANPANGYAQGLSCSNALQGATGAIVGASMRPLNFALTGVGFSRTAYLEPQYVYQGTGQNAINVVNWQINLSLFVNTLLAMDKDILFNETCYLRIVWAPSTNIYFTHTALNECFTGAAAAVGSVTLTNLGLFLATEQNPVIEANLREKLKSGMSLTIPFVYANKINLAAGNSTISTRYSKGHGQKLRAIYWIPYNNTEQSLTAYDHAVTFNAGASTRITDFYVTVNNVRLHQFNLQLAQGDDYMIARDRLRGSCILSANEFYYNYMQQFKFTDNYAPFEKPQFNPSEQNFTDGLLLDTEQLIDIRANTLAQLNHYVFAVIERTLIINDTGADIV